MVFRSHSEDRGCSGCKVETGDIQLMWCIVPAADTTPLWSRAAYWEGYPSRVIYLHKIHCQVKILCVWRYLHLDYEGNASVTAMTWDLLDTWRWSVHSQRASKLCSCRITSVCFSSWMESLDTARITPGHSPAAMNIICRLSGITTCKVQLRLQGMLVPF